MPLTSSDLERFTRRVGPPDEQGNQFWLGATNSGGYGIFPLSDGQGWALAHRIACEIANGPPPFEGAFACHACDKPRCVAGPHLWWGSAKDNALDAYHKGRMIPPRRGAPLRVLP